MRFRWTVTGRPLKPEVRVLGAERAASIGGLQLAACVVMKGSLWLDAVFLIGYGDVDGLASAIKSTPHYHELRFLALSSSILGASDLPRLHGLLGLPAMLFARVEGGWRLVAYEGLSEAEVGEVLSVASGPEGPEALRLASAITPIVRGLLERWGPYLAGGERRRVR